MPVPGPRTQYGPDPGYNNPGSETPTRINRWLFPTPKAWPGQTPGLMFMTRRGNVLGAGQIRRLYRQAVNLFNAQAPYSWTQLSPTPGRPTQRPGPVGVTIALRYLTRSLYMGQGIDNTRYIGLHTVIPKFNRQRYVTINAGQKRMPPTTRNRISSFGSRVPPAN